MKAVRLIIMGLVLLVVGGTAWLSARPALRPGPNNSSANHTALPALSISSMTNAFDVGIGATPSLVTVGNTSVVTVTSQVTEPSLILNSVNLFRLDGAGKIMTNLGQM